MTFDQENCCANCRYDLMGLGEMGQCPECGTFFNRTTGEGVYRPHSTAEQLRRTDRLLERMRTLALMLGTLITLAVAAWLYYGVQSQKGGLICLLFAGLLAMAAVTSFVCEKSDL